MKRAGIYLPDGWWRWQDFIEALLSQEPICIHFAFSLDFNGSTRFNDVATGLFEAIAGCLRHMNAP